MQAKSLEDPIREIAEESYRWKRLAAAARGEYLPQDLPEPESRSDPLATPTKSRILSNEAIARHVGYDRFTEATRKFLRGLGVEPMKGRRDAWDIEAVNRALDRANGFEVPAPVDVDPCEEWFRDDDAQSAIH